MTPINTFDRPVVGITLGDFNGVGPELILKTLSDPRILKICIPVVYGNYKLFARYKKVLGHYEEVNFHSIKSFQELHTKKINLFTTWEDDFEITPSTPTKESGKAAFLSLEKAVGDALVGNIHAIVTAPIDKKNIQQEGFKFAGHTEYLAERCGVKDNLMVMVSPTMKVALATAHIPVSQIASTLTKEVLITKINLLYQSLKKDFGISKPKIAVLGLNPHAGENGMMGKEEENLIIPVINEIKEKGVLLFGPFPADGFFGQHHYSKFDGVLAMYHDQGLTPFKSLCFDEGVNFTGGLPFIRTSPDHGTAYDLAGKNLVIEDSFRSALYLACDLVKSSLLVNK
jgi:4-hydroxythreonine-4-phosphate dehydrogenase